MRVPFLRRPARFLKGEALYRDTEYCLGFLRNLRSRSRRSHRERLWAHAYWQGELGAKPVLSLKSFLATQDPAQFSICLWLEETAGFPEHHTNPHLAPLLPLITVKPFSAVREAARTPLAPVDGDIPEIARQKSILLNGGKDSVNHSNTFRQLILYKYGGIYFDLDVLFLRDLRLLFDALRIEEFCYRWALEPYANSALLKLHQQSRLAQRLLLKGIRLGSYKPRLLLNFDDRNLDMWVLPSGFFDPFWLSFDVHDASPPRYFQSFADFFGPSRTACSFDEFYAGAFAYHWHNQWNAAELRDSFAGRFNWEIDQRLWNARAVQPACSFTQAHTREAPEESP